MDEFSIIRKYFSWPHQRSFNGVGDDCAILPIPEGDCLVVTHDSLVASRHFFHHAQAADIAYKALAVNVSDLAAAGAEPLGFTLALTLEAIDEPWLASFSTSLRQAAIAFDIELIGGDITQGPLAISICAMGGVAKKLARTRRTAQVGDDIWVSGYCGLARCGLALLRNEWSYALDSWSQSQRDLAINQLLRPSPRLALSKALRGIAKTAIDISDGLLADLKHICDRSNTSALIDESLVDLHPHLLSLPQDLQRKCYFSGGDDYELLFCAHTPARAVIEGIAQQLQVPLNRIGMMQAPTQPILKVMDQQCHDLDLSAFQGFQHFVKV